MLREFLSKSNGTDIIIPLIERLYLIIYSKTREKWRKSVLTLFRMGFFGAAHGLGGAKRSKKCINTRHTLWILLTSAFFTRNQQIFVYQEIQIYIAFWCAIFNSFNFFWVFKDFFNKRGYNFDDVSKNGYSKPS